MAPSIELLEETEKATQRFLELLHQAVQELQQAIAGAENFNASHDNPPPKGHALLEALADIQKTINAENAMDDKLKGMIAEAKEEVRNYQPTEL